MLGHEEATSELWKKYDFMVMIAILIRDKDSGKEFASEDTANEVYRISKGVSDGVRGNRPLNGESMSLDDGKLVYVALLRKCLEIVGE